MAVVSDSGAALALFTILNPKLIILRSPYSFMASNLEEIVASVKDQAPKLQTRAEFDNFKASIMGPKGNFTEARKQIGQLPPEQRPQAGKAINTVKLELEALFEEILTRIEALERKALIGPAIDPTLPSQAPLNGSLHPLTQVREEIASIFHKIGFTVAEGPEIETDFYCFEALNIPDHHPARDAHDTYFLPADTNITNIPQRKNEPYLLRTHTSPVQIRTLLKEKPPLRILSPGRCFRRDTADATHSANFHQIEGLYIDRTVTVRDLKAVLDFFVRELFSSDAEIRLRPSFFPFTEPSFEMDFRSSNLGKLSHQWVEIMGCGMVNPAVLEAVAVNPNEWTGYAFGMGIERIAMILYGIDDIRYFYQNDLRFLSQFG